MDEQNKNPIVSDPQSSQQVVSAGIDKPNDQDNVATTQPTGSINKPIKRKFFSFKVLAIVAVVILLGGTSYVLQHYVLKGSPNTKLNSDETSSSTTYTSPIPTASISPALQARITQGLPPNQSSSPVAIKYITINNDRSYDKSSDSLVMSSGHYIYHESINALGGAVLGKITYDGNVVYQDPDTSAPIGSTGPKIEGSVVLSNNGLHYGYTIEQGNNIEIFVDNKLDKTITEENDLTSNSEYDALYAISNDGSSYEYLQYSDTTNNVTAVNNHGTSVAIPSTEGNACGFGTTCPVSFDGDLSNYLTSYNNKYIYDGQQISSNANVYSSSSVSSSGGHYYVNANNESYWYTISKSKLNPNYEPNGCGEDGPSFCSDKYLVSGKNYVKGYSEIIVDGKIVYKTQPTIASSSVDNWGNQTDKSSPTTTDDTNIIDSSNNPTYTGLNNVGVNDGGDYYFVQNFDYPYFVIDGKYIYSLKNTVFGSSKYTITYASINDTDNNYVIVGGSSNDSALDADIDGKVTTLSGNNIYNTELNGNTLYVYSLAEK